jgi:periplasmic protein TonB
MRAASAGLSLTVHVALGAGIVWGTLDARPHPSPPRAFVLPPYYAPAGPAGPPPPVTPTIHGAVSLPVIEIPPVPPVNVGPGRPGFDTSWLPGTNDAGRTSGDGEQPADLSIVDEPPAILAGPVPTYPELLRQAGIEGRVMLAAVVDTLGRIEPGSLAVVSTAHPGFVAPAQRALSATLFRPARMHGRAVRVRVHVPIDFRLRVGRLSVR